MNWLGEALCGLRDDCQNHSDDDASYERGYDGDAGKPLLLMRSALFRLDSGWKTLPEEQLVDPPGRDTPRCDRRGLDVHPVRWKERRPKTKVFLVTSQAVMQALWTCKLLTKFFLTRVKESGGLGRLIKGNNWRGLKWPQTRVLYLGARFQRTWCLANLSPALRESPTVLMRSAAVARYVHKTNLANTTTTIISRCLQPQPIGIAS